MWNWLQSIFKRNKQKVDQRTLRVLKRQKQYLEDFTTLNKAREVQGIVVEGNKTLVRNNSETEIPAGRIVVMKSISRDEEEQMEKDADNRLQALSKLNLLKSKAVSANTKYEAVRFIRQHRDILQEDDVKLFERLGLWSAISEIDPNSFGNMARSIDWNNVADNLQNQDTPDAETIIPKFKQKKVEEIKKCFRMEAYVHSDSAVKGKGVTVVRVWAESREALRTDEFGFWAKQTAMRAYGIGKELTDISEIESDDPPARLERMQLESKLKERVGLDMSITYTC